MRGLRQRLTRLERQTGNGDCPTCADLEYKPVFLRDDGSAYPGSRPDRCPECGRGFRTVAKVLIGIDPSRL